MRKIKCKQCEREFHYCSSCKNREPYLDCGFCSQQCWEESADYNERRTLVLNFYAMLPYECKEPLWRLINSVFYNYNYCNEFRKWMDKCEDRPFKKDKV